MMAHNGQPRGQNDQTITNDNGCMNLLISLGLKLILIVTTSIILHLIGQDYLKSYIIVLMYIICAGTLLYTIASLLIHFMTLKRCKQDLGTCAMAEVIIAAGGLISWVLVCALNGNIAMRTIEETGEPFGWASGLSGINIAIFLALTAIFVGQVFRSKLDPLKDRRRQAPAHL